MKDKDEVIIMCNLSLILSGISIGMNIGIILYKLIK